MAKATPLKTAARSIINAQACVEKVLVGSTANGKYAKIGSEVRSDIKDVIAELEDLRDGATYLTESIKNLLECMEPSAADSLKSRVAAINAKQKSFPTSDMTFTDLPPVASENNAEACAV